MKLGQLLHGLMIPGFGSISINKWMQKRETDKRMIESTEYSQFSHVLFLAIHEIMLLNCSFEFPLHGLSIWFVCFGVAASYHQVHIFFWTDICPLHEGGVELMSSSFWIYRICSYCFHYYINVFPDVFIRWFVTILQPSLQHSSTQIT